MNPPRKVKQIDSNGKVVNVWDKISEAAESTGTNYGSICNCCRGRIKTANGFNWQYDNSNIKVKRDPLDSLLDFL